MTLTRWGWWQQFAHMIQLNPSWVRNRKICNSENTNDKKYSQVRFKHHDKYKVVIMTYIIYDHGQKVAS